MQVRTKLAVPLIILVIGFALLVYGYWLPQYRSDQANEIRASERSYMGVLATALTPALLSHDFAEVYTTLDEILAERGSWQSVILKDADGKVVYPLASAQVEPGSGEWLESVIQHERVVVGVLLVNVNVESVLAGSVTTIYLMGHLMSLIP
ncbi:hypothetical protein GCM10023116_30250 [Kistimonas scapharcae]|uniref:Uncharacterized protein n=1 Tax=Kistimonas scapharcae TaxID=1036133 RepID=A0ABP8V4C5_9GAMM